MKPDTCYFAVPLSQMRTSVLIRMRDHIDQVVAGRMRALSKAKPGTKMAVVEAQLLRPDGTTREETRNAVGWPSISMQDNAQSLGMTLRIDKTTRPYRYFGSYEGRGA